MPTTDAVSNTTPSTVNTASKASMNSLNRDSFLSLLITQLQNQDPLSPMDNTQFTAQLAQFSSLERLENINDGLADLNVSSKVSQAFSVIGKKVAYTDSEGKPVTGKVESVGIKDGQPMLNVGSDSVSLDKVLAVYPADVS